MQRINSFYKTLIDRKLSFLVKLALKKHQPIVVAIAGSSRRNLTKYVIYDVLKEHFNVLLAPNVLRFSIRNVYLAILLRNKAIKAFFDVVLTVLYALWLILFQKKYAQVLLVDIGNNKRLLELIKPKVLVITNVFSRTDLKKIKKLAETLDKSSVCVLNYDSPDLHKLLCSAKKVFYGFDSKAQIRKTRPDDNDAVAVSYAKLAGLAIGLIFDLRQEDINKSLAQFVPPKGCLRIEKGIKNTIIIDDTYDASPASAIDALKYLQRFNGRKIAVFGDMLKLGKETEEKHRTIGDFAKESADVLFVVGTRSICFVADEAKKNGMDNVYEFDNVNQLGLRLQDFLQEGDVVLIDGSAKMRMDKIVQEIIFKPRSSKG